MLVIAVVAVAYGTQAPQLGVAEFAPAARSEVSMPPTTSAAPSGALGAGASRRSTTTTTARTTSAVDGSTPAALTTQVGRSRACFGSPPRQLPDPRSPACLATIFEGENGGATTRGVSGTEIRVAWPMSSAGAVDTVKPAVTAVFEFFNRAFELYGRRLVPVPVVYGSASDVVTQRTLAADIGAQGVFAALQPPVSSWYASWYQELARHRVVTVTSTAFSMLSDREFFDEYHPYMWSLYPSLEQTWTNLADFACRSLVGRPAQHAGPELRTTTRKFGIIAVGAVRVPSTRLLVDNLAACGAESVVVEWVSQRDSSAVLDAAVARLRAEGTTTAICACADISANQVSARAAARGWDPEWFFTALSNPALDEYAHQNYFSDSQRTRMFTLQPLDRTAPMQAQQWWAAAVAAGLPTVDDSSRRFVQATYEQLLVLAAGIQAAGPNLTADAFGQGLMATQFPNTGAGADPYWQASVGFGLGDHSFVSDYAIAWWDNNAVPLGAYSTPGKGTWCYVDRGARFRAGTYPNDADDRLFNRSWACR